MPYYPLDFRPIPEKSAGYFNKAFECVEYAAIVFEVFKKGMERGTFNVPVDITDYLKEYKYYEELDELVEKELLILQSRPLTTFSRYYVTLSDYCLTKLARLYPYSRRTIGAANESNGW